MDKRYYKYLDIIRFISCIAVLLYHLGLLKGGYLAVCIFFVLSGYLTTTSLLNKEKVSLKAYYQNRLKKLYLPLLVVIFISIGVLSFFKEIIWLNLKPETFSVLFLYNNYWQINAKLDYFAMFVSSPFMHLWYIAILFQFDLLFPFLFIPLKKFSDKINKKLFITILSIITLCFMGYFIYLNILNKNIMFIYYDTFSRLFSLLFGVTLGFIHHLFKPLVFEKLKKYYYLFFYFYFIILIVAFFIIGADNKLFSISMIITTLISCRLIDYSVIAVNNQFSIVEKIVKSVASVSYEVYLVQYPIIFILEHNNIMYRIPLTIVLTFLFAYLIHYALSLKLGKKDSILKYITTSLIFIASLYGLGCYSLAEDHTEEMKKLEEQLAQNEKEMAAKQKAYLENAKKEQTDWLNKLNELENGEEALSGIVLNLPVVGVGDSVMLGAINDLYGRFPNGYFDAQKSRTNWEANGILQSLKYNNMLGNPVVFGLGTNGSGPNSLMYEIINTCEDRDIYWMNVVNDSSVHVNSTFNEFAKEYSNFHVVDWQSYSSGHPEYFVADGIHLTALGREAYTNCLYEAIYNDYLAKYQAEKEKVLKEHEEALKSKFSFYGNDLLLNISESISKKYDNASYFIDNYTIKDLLKKIDSDITSEQLAYNVVFMFDSKLELTKENILSIIKKCEGHKLYFVNVSIERKDIFTNQTTLIDFSTELKEHDEYLMADAVHLTELGNKELLKKINKVIEGEIKND